MEKTFDRTYIIMFNDEKIGFYQGQLVNERTYYIENICIIPEYQGKGIGTEILKSVLNEYSATELLSLIDKEDITPQYLTKVLNEYSKTILLDNKISFTTSRTSSSRLVTLEKDIEEASEDSSKNDISIYDNVMNDDDDAKNI